MAVPWDVVAYLAIFAVILFLLVRLATKARSSPSATTTPQENPHEAKLLRFIDDESGTRVGETVAIEGDDFIVKGPQGFLAIPVTSVREEGKGLRLTQTFDEVEARRKGESWKERSHKVITYSESELPKDEPEA